MAITPDQENAGTAVNDAGSGTISVTLTEDIAPGATVLVEVGWWHASGTLSSFADDGPGLTWTIDVQGKNATQNPHSAFVRAYAPGGLTAGDVLTAAFSTAVNGRAIGVCSFTGIDPDDPVITTTAVASGATTSWECGSTTIEDGALLIAACDLDPGGSSTITGPSHEVIDTTDGSNVALTAGYRIEASGGSYTVGGTWSSASNHATVAVAYRAAPDAPSSTINVTGTFGSATAGTGGNGATAVLNPDTEYSGQAGRRAVLGVSFYDGFGPGSGLSVTDDGPGLAWEVDTIKNADSGDVHRTAALVSAAFEAGTLTETDTITVTFGQNSYCRSVCGLILDDVDNDIPVDSTGGDGTAGEDLEAPLTNVVEAVCVIAFGWEDAVIGSSTPADGYTEQFDYTHADDVNTFTMLTRVADSVGEQAPGATIAGGSGWVMASAAYRDVAAPTPPINTAAPAVTGAAQVGQTIECSTGEWLGDEPITYGYQWQRDGGPIDGATESDYLLDDADDGAQLKCTVTATNVSGSVSVDSNSVIAYPTGTFDVLYRADNGWVASTWRVRVGGEWTPPVES